MKMSTGVWELNVFHRIIYFKFEFHVQIVHRLIVVMVYDSISVSSEHGIHTDRTTPF